MEEELVDILDKKGFLTGKTCTKTLAHKKGYLHPTVHIWVFTSDKKVLLQQRSLNKDTFPEFWDVSVAGHISAGEDAITSAVREIKEEIGLQVSKDQLNYLGSKRSFHKHSENLIDNELHHIYTLKKNIKEDELIIQEEVAKVKLIDLDTFIEELKINASIFVPHGEDYYKMIINAIKDYFKG